jgi:uncharacterized repeat protein (TIGR01451 family)
MKQSKYTGKSQNRIKLLLYVFLLSFVFLIPSESFTQITYSVSKSNNAPTPIQSGLPFTYTITYSWSGGAPGTLYIQDIVPPELEVLSALPSSPVSTISGNTVNFAISGLTLPSGSGTVQINARFPEGVTCGGIQACNTAMITDDRESDKWEESNESCVISAEPVNRWELSKTKIAGCALDDEVVYRICITAPSGNNIGGLNLNLDTNALQDMLPLGAEITDVSGWWTGPNGSISTGGWTDLTGGPLVLNVNSYPSWYCTYVKVSYPSSLFSQGDTVLNKARLTFRTPCDTAAQVFEDSVSTVLCDGVFTGSLNKYFAYNINFYNNPYYYPTFAPGCCGEYRMWYRNTGTLAQQNVIIEDTLSGDVDVNSIITQIPNDPQIVPVTLEVFTWNGVTCDPVPAAVFTYPTVGTQIENTLPANICRLKWTYDTIPVNTIVRHYIDVCVRDTNFITGAPVIPGSVANNQMDVHADTLHLSDEVNTVVDSIAPNVISTKLFIGECDAGSINPNGPFMPGDTVRYRMAVANVGNQDANLANIIDNLPTGFSYVGNETYYYGNFSYNVNQYNPNCDLFTDTVPTQIGGSITSPSVGDTSLMWNFPVLPARCDGFVEFFLIEFDVALSEDPPVLAGQHDNAFVFNADNSPAVTSNQATMTVNAIAQLQVIKEVRKQGSGLAWANIADVPVGQNAEFKLSVINTGNTPLTQICLLDIAPWVGDINVLPPYNPRNSQFDMPYNPADGAISITPSGYTDTYNTAAVGIQQNPSRASECGGFCGIADPFGAVAGTYGAATNTYSYKVNADAGISLAAGATLEILVPSKVPSGTTVADTACNSFAMSAIPAGLPNVCLSAESNNACVVAAKEDEPGPCLIVENIRVECKEVDGEGNQVYGFSTQLFSNVGYTTNINLVSTNGSFYNLSPTTLPTGVLTTVTADFITSLSAGDTLCVVIELKDAEQRTVCKEQVCFEIPPCDDKTECECPFKINTEPLQAGQEEGTSFYMSSFIGTTGAYLKWVRATIVSAQIVEDCDGQITTYNTGAVFQTANNWLSYTPSGLGTPSVTWESKECDSLNQFVPNYTLDIPFTSAEKCRLKVKICVRYEFYDCDCNWCEVVICREIDVKNPISGIAREDGLSKRTISSNVYPNPIESQLNIDYSLKTSSIVSIVIRDLTGNEITRLVDNERREAGDYTIDMDTMNIPSGVYIYTIETESESHTKKFVIEK